MIKVEELFALALRIIGVLLLFYGLHGLLDAGLFQLGYFTYQDSSVGYYLISGLFYSVVGLYLLRGAPGIVRFAYRANEEDEEETEGDDDEGDGERDR
jgi:hypothetical protein